MKSMGIDEIFRGGSLTEDFVSCIREHAGEKAAS